MNRTVPKKGLNNKVGIILQGIEAKTLRNYRKIGDH